MVIECRGNDLRLRNFEDVLLEFPLPAPLSRAPQGNFGSRQVPNDIRIKIVDHSNPQQRQRTSQHTVKTGSAMIFRCPCAAAFAHGANAHGLIPRDNVPNPLWSKYKIRLFSCKYVIVHSLHNAQVRRCTQAAKWCCLLPEKSWKARIIFRTTMADVQQNLIACCFFATKTQHISGSEYTDSRASPAISLRHTRMDDFSLTGAFIGSKIGSQE